MSRLHNNGEWREGKTTREYRNTRSIRWLARLFLRSWTFSTAKKVCESLKNGRLNAPAKTIKYRRIRKRPIEFHGMTALTVYGNPRKT